MSLFFPKSVGGNAKTGILTSTSSSDTCPDTCPLKQKGCYAKSGPIAMVWRKVSDRIWETPLPEFLARIKKLPIGSLWRFNQCGDLPGINNDIDEKTLMEIVNANRGRKGFSYTHKPLTTNNLRIIREANDNGFTINISVETLDKVDTVMEIGLPVVVILPENSEKIVKTLKGRNVLVCPQQRNKEINCGNCGLCQNKDRRYAIGFIAHGISKKTVGAIISQ